MKEYSLRMYDKKTPAELIERTNEILNNLTIFGRHVSPLHKNIGHSISRRFGKASKDGVVSFGWNPYTKKSMVILDTNYIMIKKNNGLVKIIRR